MRNAFRATDTPAKTGDNVVILYVDLIGHELPR